jgi:hypothetical protein
MNFYSSKKNKIILSFIYLVNFPIKRLKVSLKIICQWLFAVLQFFAICIVYIMSINSIQVNLFVRIVPWLNFSISKDEIENSGCVQNAKDEPENGSEGRENYSLGKFSLFNLRKVNKPPFINCTL